MTSMREISDEYPSNHY